MLQKIAFANYKLFKDWQELELKPITVLIGKNSSGKSAIAKLPTLISQSLQGTSDEPINLINEGVEIGAEFRDLVYGRNLTGVLELKLTGDQHEMQVNIASGVRTQDAPQIVHWKLESQSGTIEKTSNQVFKGFIPQGHEGQKPKGFNVKTDYIGPIRKSPERINEPQTNRKIEKIGNDGANAYPLLYQDDLKTDGQLVRQVDAWYKKNFEGWGIRVNRDRAPYYEVELTWKDELKINLRDVGEGMSQVLPIVTRAFMPADKDTLIIIEQPELHLHPAAHGSLAQLFVERVSDGKGRYLIETHSKNLVLRLRRLVAEQHLSADKLLIYYVDFDQEKGNSELRRIEVDETGNVDYWPEHVFSESLDEAIALRTAQLNLEGYGR